MLNRLAALTRRLALGSIHQSALCIALGLVILLLCHGVFWAPVHRPLLWRELANSAAVLLMLWGYLSLYLKFGLAAEPALPAAEGIKTSLSTPKDELNPKAVWGWAAVLFGLGWLLAAFHSTDVTGYINRGWQQSHYHTNPYLTVIDALPGWQQDPMLTNHWVNNPAPYGFAFMHVARWVTQLGQGQFALTLGAFKLVGLGCVLAIAGIIRSVGQRALGWSAQKGLKAQALVLMHPLFLLHTLANGHNDALMCVLMLLGVACVMFERFKALALPTLMLAGLIKLAAWVVMPLALIWQWRRGDKQAALVGLGLSGTVFLLIAWPYLFSQQQWLHWPVAAMAGNATVVHNSLMALVWDPLKALLKLLGTTEPERALWLKGLKAVFSVGFLGVYGLLVKRTWQTPNVKPVSGAVPPPEAPTRQTFVWLALAAQGALVMVFSAKFYPWYVNMLWPLALWLYQPNSPQASPPLGVGSGATQLARCVLAISVGQVLGVTALGQAHVLNVLLMWLLPVGFVLLGKQSRGFDE
ncbi:MAG: hypothetical protein VKJ06_08215 [Vampirovibrionales bacterium]|nr:hypothetical protein [Vampirovibrionales bacterium]